jgi:L-2,4-diaminobutyrate transaminase
MGRDIRGERNMLHNDQLDQWDRENLFHPSTHLGTHSRGESPNRIVTGASGCRITDRDGKEYLDGFAGLYCVNVGYGQHKIIEAIKAQAEQLAFYHSYVGHGHEAGITLAKMVIDRAPDHMSKVYFGLGGSDANETNVKLIWYLNNILGRPQKKKIISRMRGYHGSGLMTGSLTGLTPFHKNFDLPLGQVLHTTAPYYYRRDDLDMTEADFTAKCAADLEAMIEREGPDTIAAFIAEPVMGTGGIVPPPAGYWDAIQPILKKHDILLICDEVITGFGRLGTMFGCEKYGIRPDLMTVAKGLTSAYAPLSGSIISEEVFAGLVKGNDDFGPLGHGWTYSAHPIGAAAGVANLEVIDELGLIDNVNDVGPYFGDALRAALGNHPNVGEVRSVGMLAAVELVADKANRTFFDPEGKTVAKVTAALAGQGVIARAMPQSDIIGFAPPLCLTRDDADQIATATRKALAEALG